MAAQSAHGRRRGPAREISQAKGLDSDEPPESHAFPYGTEEATLARGETFRLCDGDALVISVSPFSAYEEKRRAIYGKEDTPL